MNDTESIPPPATVPTDVALCLDPQVYRRLRPILGHLCVGLIDYGVAVRLISPSPDVGSLAIGPIQLLTYERPRWPMTHLRASREKHFRSLAEKLAERPPTVVHAISAGSFELAAFLARRFDVSLVLQITAFADVDALTPQLVEQADCLIVSSQPLLDRLEEVVALPTGQVALIRPGTLAGAEPTCFVHPHAVPTLLCSEDFRPGCGVLQLLRAARILFDRQWQFLTFLTGSGPLERDFRKRARDLDLATRVVFARPTRNIERIMTGADVFIQPSPHTALTVAPMYALANGVAVVAVEGGVSDYFVDGVTALVCRNPSPTVLAEAIEGLLQDHSYAQRLAVGAINHIRTHHTISNMAEQTLSRYRALIDAGRTFAIDAD